MKKFIVTGCAGFIGFEVARQLLSDGHFVLGIDNLNDYYDVGLKEWRVESLKVFDQFLFYPVDVENKVEVTALVKDHQWEACYHLAARAGVRASMEDPYIYLSTNTLGTLNLLECMREYDIAHLVMASTSSIYANEDLPFSEDKAVNRPISPYAASKKGAELMAHSYHYLYDKDITITRFFTVYGPYGRPDMCIFRFIYWIDQNIPITLFGDGTQSRDFTYVSDIARGTIACSRLKGYHIVNLGGGKEPVNLNQVIASLETLLGKKATIEHKTFHKADIKSTKADISTAKSLLGWEPQTSLEAGLENTVRWYIDNRERVKKITLPCS
jgi:nucleoside-diphosphate-sugar epimerase